MLSIIALYSLQQLHPVSVDEGTPVLLSVICEAEPEPSFDWYCNGILLENAGDYVIRQNRGESSLSVAKSQPKHTGLYKCVANNVAGRAVSEGRVEVKKKGE